MPSLFRFLVVVSTICGLVYGSLYILANQFEPPQQEVSEPLPGVKVRRQ